jgi:hypothetical protein
VLAIFVKIFASKFAPTMHVLTKLSFEETQMRKNAARMLSRVFLLFQSVTQSGMRRGVQNGLGHASATPASVASDAFRVLARSTQVLRLFWAKKIDRLRDLLFIGAQKRTRTSTPYGTRT